MTTRVHRLGGDTAGKRVIPALWAGGGRYCTWREQGTEGARSCVLTPRDGSGWETRGISVPRGLVIHAVSAPHGVTEQEPALKNSSWTSVWSSRNNGLAGSQVCDSAPGDLGQQRVVSTPPWGGEAGFPEGQLQGEDPRRSPQH